MAQIKQAFFTFEREGSDLQKEFKKEGRFISISHKDDWVASRSINLLIWALMLVTIVRPGAFAGISVFRWDINIRESTVLGLVGAGGIGLELNASIMNLAWTQVSLILIVIIITVTFSELVSAKVRHAII